jgi:hypothetical protein
MPARGDSRAPVRPKAVARWRAPTPLDGSHKAAVNSELAGAVGFAGATPEVVLTRAVYPLVEQLRPRRHRRESPG